MNGLTLRVICFLSILATSLWAACTEPFSPIWLVKQPKIIGIEADVPWGTPGTLVTVNAHLVDAQGAVTELQDEISWQFCGGDISRDLKGDVLCENLLQTQKGTMSVTFELPDIFENQPLQGHALANALSGYPIWVKLFWRHQTGEAVAQRRIWVFQVRPFTPWMSEVPTMRSGYILILVKQNSS